LLVPLGHRLLVKPDKIQEVDEVYRSAKESGLFVPETTQRQEQIAIDTGEVLALGEVAFKDCYDGLSWCKVGDKVAYAKFGGKIIKDPKDGEEYLILNDIDVICRFD